MDKVKMQAIETRPPIKVDLIASGDVLFLK